MNERQRLGLPSVLWCEPIARALQERDDVEVLLDSPTRIAVMLREQLVHAAFLSPVDYAREGSMYRIVPGVAVCSRSANNAITLHFREGLHTIRSLAVDPRSVAEIILARVILAEEFDVAPKIVPVDGPLDMMLNRGDAAVLIGDEALRQAVVRRDMVDLGEAWSELTGLPYVHGFWCTREGQLTAQNIKHLENSGKPGGALLDSIAFDAIRTHSLPGSTPATLRTYLDSFTYELDADVEEGIREFLKFAYYHGVLPDVPELNYLSGEDQHEDADGEIAQR